MTRKEFVARLKADVCNTQSRSKNGKKYHNKYSELLGKLGYKGINKKGVHTKKYSYGVVGHCCERVLYHLIQGGMSAFCPKSAGYINNTNAYANYLKKQPTIKGYGKVIWYNDIKKAKEGDVIFKGKKGSKSFTHTCVCVDPVKNGYITTNDGNVTGKKNGKTYNNGINFKRKTSKYKWGVARLPFPSLTMYEVNTNVDPLNIRVSPSTDSKVVGRLPRGEVVYVEYIKDGWARLPKYDNIYEGYCSTKYLKKG